MMHQAFSFLSRNVIRSPQFFVSYAKAQPQPIFQQIYKNIARSSIRRQTTRREFTSKSRLRVDQVRGSEPSKVQAEASKSLSQRLKDLSKEYGWTAVGTYFALSALDFPFCFLAVRSIGTEKIAAVEHAVVEWVKRVSPVQIPEKYRFWKKTAEEGQVEAVGWEPYDHGVKEAEIANKGDGASLGTQLALAYAIHKSFIFVRVPLTAAILPKVVKTLRGWGWKIGKKPPKVDPVP